MVEGVPHIMPEQGHNQPASAGMLAVHFLQQLAWFAILVLSLLLVAPAHASSLSPERQGELRGLLYQDCGSCHGMKLTGGLGPPLLASRLSQKPRALLLATVRDGRAGTPMPPWKNLLSEADIDWLVDYLLDAGEQQQ